MNQRRRKFAGTFACVAFLIAYCLVVMAVGGHFVVGSNGVAELAFYAAAGFAWLPVAMLIIRWMARPDAP
jgi:Protein of unknown function (DUF2842)